MKPIKTFIIGSIAFFSGMEGFTPKDIDELNIMDEFPFKFNSMHLNKFHGKDVFFFKNMDKNGFIQDAKKSKLSMVVGKFIVPEFANYIGLTIKDLKDLEELFDNIDEKHSYEKIIYDAYLENNGFFLNEEQKKNAFNKYKETR